MDIGFSTDRGRLRTNNEDAFYILKPQGVFIVADGVGGNNSGEIASRTGVNEVARFVEENPLPDGEDAARAFFREAMERANFRIYDMSERYPEDHGMATTMVIAYIRGDDLFISNVGDSRAYLWTPEGGLNQLTEDHTYVNVLIHAGVLSKEEARSHQDKNMITKALGAEETVEPDFFHTTLGRKDRLLLCTDGLYGEMEEEQIAHILSADEPMPDICARLIEAANAEGGTDNITAICIDREDVR